MAAPIFTAHNILLDDGTQTYPEAGGAMAEYPWFKAAIRALKLAFPTAEPSSLRIADLGCFEGGYAVEFARSGYWVTGIEARRSNYEKCLYVKDRVSLENLSFFQSDAWNLRSHGEFDAIFCCGLLYHIDRPRAFLQLLSDCCRRLAIVNTHFASDEAAAPFSLSPVEIHEGLPGRWLAEVPREATADVREAASLSAWRNPRSFWLTKPALVDTLREVGFDMAIEQFDAFPMGRLAEQTTPGNPQFGFSRGCFLGIKSLSAS